MKRYVIRMYGVNREVIRMSGVNMEAIRMIESIAIKLI